MTGLAKDTTLAFSIGKIRDHFSLWGRRLQCSFHVGTESSSNEIDFFIFPDDVSLSPPIEEMSARP